MHTFQMRSFVGCKRSKLSWVQISSLTQNSGTRALSKASLCFMLALHLEGPLLSLGQDNGTMATVSVALYEGAFQSAYLTACSAHPAPGVQLPSASPGSLSWLPAVSAASCHILLLLTL